MRARLYPILRRLALLVLLMATGIMGWTQLDAWQRQTIFSPEADQQRWWQDAPDKAEIFDLALNNGDHVRAWYMHHADTNAPAVLYLHGSRWNLNGSVFRMRRWLDMGYSVLAIDYRGFGESTSLLPSEKTALEDAEAALQELERRQPNAAQRFIYGHSLGGAIAVDLAVRPDAPDFAGLIVESSFTSTRDMLRTLKWGNVPGAGLLVTQRFASAQKLSTLTKPLLLIHGTADHVVPHTMSDELFAAATQVPDTMKRLVKIDGGSHSGSIRSGTRYQAAVTEFTHDASQSYVIAHSDQDATQRIPN